LCDIVPDYRTKEGARTVAAGLSSASRENVQKNRRFGRLVENRCKTCLSRYFSNDIPKLHSNSAHSTSADNTATPPPTDRVPLVAQKTRHLQRRLSRLCHIVPDYRTFIEDYLKIVEFIEWLKDFYPEKAAFLTKNA
jgi:hypothetical protein